MDERRYRIETTLQGGCGCKSTNSLTSCTLTNFARALKNRLTTSTHNILNPKNIDTRGIDSWYSPIQTKPLTFHIYNMRHIRTYWTSIMWHHPQTPLKLHQIETPTPKETEQRKTQTLQATPQHGVKQAPKTRTTHCHLPSAI